MLGQGSAAHVCTDNGDSFSAVGRNGAAHLLDQVFRNFGKGEIIADAQMPFGHTVKAGFLEILYDFRLYIVGIWCHQTKITDAVATEQIVVGKDRGSGWRARGFGDAGAQLFIVAETQPTGGGPVPGDDVAFRIRQ